MKYFFIPGNNLELSLAEILAYFRKSNGFFVSKNAIMSDLESEEPKGLLKRLGGIIKYGTVVKELSDVNYIEREIMAVIKENWPEKDKKIAFGVSFYGDGKLNTRKSGMSIKMNLKQEGYKVRLVESRDKQLSSVVVNENIIRKKGLEFVVIKMNGKIFLGRTINVQPFKDLSFRDFGRPGRDDYSGMLPPKLAQIIINLAAKGRTDLTLLDPFCGSGTIITEASLMGFNNVVGADASDKAIKDTRKNIDWIKNKYQLDDFKAELYNCRVENINKHLKPASVDIIVTEPYLGPQRGRPDARVVKKELDEMYSKSLSALKKVLKSDGIIVMIWPVINAGGRRTYLNPQIKDLEVVPLLPASFIGKDYCNVSKRNTFIYMRPGQRVAREIIALKHK